MNKISESQKWTAIQAALKQQYPQLTEADLRYQEGMHRDMLRMVAYKLGKTKVEMLKIVALL